jgi:type IV pilus assembly protein PilY1
MVQIDRTRPISGDDELVRYVIRDATTGAVVSSDRCAAKTWCTWQEEAQNFANWYTYYRNRMFSAIAVMAESMSSMQEDKFQNLRIGYGRINYFSGAWNPWNINTTFSSIGDIDGEANPGALIRGVRPFMVGSPERQQFFDWLFSLAWSGATPNREAVDAAGRYFSRRDNRGPWGAIPGTDSSLPQIACRRNYTLLTTDGEWTNVSAGQPLISATGPLDGPGTPTGSDNVSGPTLKSDIDGAVFTYQPANYPQFTGGTPQDRTLTDATVYYWNRDLRPDLPNVVKPITATGRTNEAFWQSMSTYIVGYGLFASMDTTVTRSAINAGSLVNWPEVEGVGTATFDSASAANRVNDSFRAAVASRGQFYTATSVETLAGAVHGTFEDLVIQTGSAGGVALTGPVLQADHLFYRPSYFLGKDTYGKLEAFKVSDMASLATNPDAVTPQWNASVPTTRTILTSTAAVGAGAVFSAANVRALTLDQQTQLGGGNSSLADEVIQYLSGDALLELAKGGPFRNRVSPFGTFVNSQPLYSKAPDFGYAGLTDVGPAYKTFVDNNKASRTAAVYIGGNAGMFHAFRADTGVELFAYVPRGVYDNLYSLTQAGMAHRYFVDGPVVQGDAYLGGAWQNIVVGTTGAGGASIFALDVTDPTQMDASKVLFDVTKAESNDLGNVVGTGVVGRIKTGTDTYEWVYIVGNGVESKNHRAALLVIGLEGSNKGVVRSIPVGPEWDKTEAKRNGMGGVSVVFGAQRSIIAVYAGDKLGNLWRFDFSGGEPQQASGFGGANSPLFTATDGTDPQPMTTAPVLYPYGNDQWYIVFGTGKLYDISDPTNAGVQTVYGIIFDPNQGSKILKTELNPVSVKTGTFDATSTEDKRRGWYLNLEAGERVIGNPSIANSLIRISTYKPQSSINVCLGGGSSRLLTVNVLSSRGSVEDVTATVANPVPHYRPRDYGSSVVSPTRAQVQQALKGRTPSPTSAQCRLTTVAVDKTIGGTGQSTACPQTPVLRVWRPLTR